MSLQFRDRPYQLFISYAHEDVEFVSEVSEWLTKVAGVRVWRDDERLPIASSVSHSLSAAVAQARAALFVISRASARSGWVREEFAAAIGQRASNPGYRVLALRLDNAEVPQALETTVYVTVPDRRLTADTAYRILCALHTDATTVSPRDAKDLYVSRTWRASESVPADEICGKFADSGFRLVGDSLDRTSMDRSERLESIISGCEAMVAILPLRGADKGTSPYVLEEVGIARRLGVPYLLVADAAVAIPDELVNSAIDGRVHVTADLLDDDSLVSEAIESVRECFHQTRRPDFVFYAGSLSNAGNDRACSLIQAVTGLDCIMGQDLYSQHAQQAIIDRIARARFVMADVSEDNRNTLIEAGIARGAGRPLILLSEGRPQPNRFMFRDLETNYYTSETELLGLIYRLTYPYRRRILNDELR
ncbi:toll/interleukin-1 receptor domain-containing protein [Streptacidiphilus sp. EB129]|uniref:toll/interleukin-1 receptor domain-containing protein n=1 Tax=Streptacidiphilus sp. EB129 TaxID=3156262 RepID=UPI0035195697